MKQQNMHPDYVKWCMVDHPMGWQFTLLQGKKPIRKNWPKLKLEWPVIEDHMKRPGSEGNIGLITGSASNVVVVDVDHEGAEKDFDLPKTVMVKTGKGRHYYYHFKGVLGNSVSKLADGIDIRAENGQVVFPGSIHPDTGSRYEFIGHNNPWDRQKEASILAPLPEWIVQACRTDTKVTPEKAKEIQQGITQESSVKEVRSIGWYVNTALTNECTAVKNAHEGTRNDTLNKSAYRLGKYVGGGALNYIVVEKELFAAAVLADPEEDPKQIKDTIRSGLSKGMGAPIKLKEKPPEAIPSTAEPGEKIEMDPERSAFIPGQHITDEGVEFHVSDFDFANTALAATPTGTIYNRSGTIGVLNGMGGKLAFEPITPYDFRYAITQYVGLYAWKAKRVKTGTTRILQRVNWSTDYAKVCMSGAINQRNAHMVQPIEGIVCHPIFDKEWRLMEPGYNKDSRIFYDQPAVLEDMRPIRDMEKIHEIYADLVTDFPFKTPADRDNFMGLMLTPIIASAAGSTRPLHLITASLERTGKTMLGKVLGLTMTGAGMPEMQYALRDEENDKRILAALMSGETMINIDNIPEKINSASIASLLTADAYTSRYLGESKLIKLPNTMTVIATGNNTRCTGEMSKRVIPIELQPRDNAPELRTSFQHPDLRGHIIRSRGQILGCLVGMVLNWLEAGQPRGAMPKGGFEDWARVVGGIMHVNMFHQWRLNERAWQCRFNDDQESREGFVSAWWHSFGPSEQRASGLVKLLESNPEVLPDIGSRDSERGRVVRLGNWLKQHVDQPIGAWIIRGREAQSRKIYRLEHCKRAED